MWPLLPGLLGELKTMQGKSLQVAGTQEELSGGSCLDITEGFSKSGEGIANQLTVKHWDHF